MKIFQTQGKHVQRIKKQGNVTVLKHLLVECDYVIEYKSSGGVRNESASTGRIWTLYCLSEFDYTLRKELKTKKYKDRI